MNKKIAIISSIIVIAVLAVVVILSNTKNKIPDNPPETVGNTAGNLNNMGLFCESEGKIFFSNPLDNNYLYSMDLDTTNVKRLMDVPAAYINAGGDYLYFYYADQGEVKFMGVAGNMRGLYRLDKKGKSDLACLERSTSGIANLIGNRIYYEHYDNVDGMTLYYVSTDGKDKEQVVKSIINPACVLYGNIYYPDQENNFYLNVYNPGASAGQLYVEEGMYNPTCVGQYIYYMKLTDDYKLYRFDTSTGTAIKISNDRVDTFNVHGDRVFYQRNKNAALVSVNSDGSNPVVIAEGNYKNINCTSVYTFFQSFSDDQLIYMTPTNGAGGFSNFYPTTE